MRGFRRIGHGWARRLHGWQKCIAVLVAGGTFVSAALAGPPVPYGGYTVSKTGSITAPCPAGYKCVDSMVAQGILQRVITDATGKSFIQQIVDDGSTLRNTTARMESFVAGTGSSYGGIASRQMINSTGATVMDSTVTLEKGWANSGLAAAVRFTQSISDNIGKPPAIYSSTMSYSRYQQGGSGPVTGSYLDLRQDVTNSTAISGAAVVATGRDVHAFVTRIASGNMVPAGSATLPASAAGMMGAGGGPTGGSVSWGAGNMVQVVYIGQVCMGCADPAAVQQFGGGGGGGGGGGMGGGGMGGGMMGGATDATFMYQSYDNLSDTAAAIATRSIISTQPANWVNPPFGTAPAAP